jgi:hypothetical protein
MVLTVQHIPGLESLENIVAIKMMLIGEVRTLDQTVHKIGVNPVVIQLVCL